jgi:hypothetical protein
MTVPSMPLRIIDRSALDSLIDALRRRGYTVVGPTVRSGSIEYDELRSADELPAGWSDEQEGGSYRLLRRDDAAVFGHTGGHTSAKRFLFPPLCACGVRGGNPTARSSRSSGPARSPATPSSACARATSTPSPSRTASLSGTATSSRTTPPVAPTRSSWR